MKMARLMPLLVCMTLSLPPEIRLCQGGHLGVLIACARSGGLGSQYINAAINVNLVYRGRHLYESPRPLRNSRSARCWVSRDRSDHHRPPMHQPRSTESSHDSITLSVPAAPSARPSPDPR